MAKWLGAVLGVCGCTATPAPAPPAAASANPVAAAPSPEATAESAPEPLLLPGRWLSLFGASLRLPEEWRDETEYSFRIPERRKGHLELDTDPEVSLAFAVDRHQVMLEMASSSSGRGMSVSDIRTTPTPWGEASLFEVAFGSAPNSEAMAMAVIPHQPFWLKFTVSGERQDLASLPQAQAKLEKLPPGELLPPAGRYAVLDVSFAWPAPLSLPHYFSFSSQSGARLRLHWEAEPLVLSELEWHSQFSVPSDAPVQVLRAEQGPVQGESVSPPRGFAAPTLSFMHLARVVRAPDYSNGTQLLVFAHGYAQLGSRYLNVEYFQEGPKHSTLDEFYRLLGTLHAQEGP